MTIKDGDVLDRLLDSAIRNIIGNMLDEAIKVNAKVSAEVGLRAYIIREELSSCCDWCHSIAGRYEYGTEPKDVYRKHDNCKCMVIFKRDKEPYQDVWSKKKYDTYNEARNERIKSIKNLEKNLESEKLIEKTNRDSKINSRISGALNPYSNEGAEHAHRYYGLVRKMTTDVKRISKTTGLPESDIQRIKNFIFMDKHDLGGKLPEYFEPDCMMAQSWQRLVNGTPEPHDIILIKHEKMEMELMAKGMSQSEAHIKTSKIYNYEREAGLYYAKVNQHKKK